MHVNSLLVQTWTFSTCAMGAGVHVTERQRYTEDLRLDFLTDDKPCLLSENKPLPSISQEQ